MIVSLNARQHAIELIDRKSDEIMTIVGRIRNGVETIPSVLRRKYNVDEMPVRGKLRTGQFFGIKMHSLIFSKLLRYTQGLEKCRPLSPQIE
jgi:acid phosphatase class B